MWVKRLSFVIFSSHKWWMTVYQLPRSAVELTPLQWWVIPGPRDLRRSEPHPLPTRWGGAMALLRPCSSASNNYCSYSNSTCNNSKHSNSRPSNSSSNISLRASTHSCWQWSRTWGGTSGRRTPEVRPPWRDWSEASCTLVFLFGNVWWSVKEVPEVSCSFALRATQLNMKHYIKIKLLKVMTLYIVLWC